MNKLLSTLSAAAAALGANATGSNVFADGPLPAPRAYRGRTNTNGYNKREWKRKRSRRRMARKSRQANRLH